MKLLLVFDVPGWCWEKKCMALQKYLSPHFEKIRIMPLARFMKEPDKIVKAFDSIHFLGWRYGEQWAKYCSTTVASYDYENPQKRGDAKKILNKYRAVVTTNQDLQRVLREDVGVESYCLPNGVDHTVFVPPEKRDNDKLVVGWAGKPMWTISKSRCPNEIQWYGEGGIWPILKEKFAQIPGVEVREVANMPDKAISTEEMVKWYQGVDVFICPHAKCGSPNPAFEAAACGCCVVTTPCGAIQEMKSIVMIEGYEAGGVSEVVNRFSESVLALQENRDIAEITGRMARLVIEKDWTWEKRALAWLPMLRKAAYK